MSKINTGGAAFPGEKDIRFAQANDCNEGMTLRDYFAAKALTVLYKEPKLGDNVIFWSETIKNNRERCAEESYKMADAMLNAREA